MLLKLIRCEIKPERTKAFALAQSNWTKLAKIPGFLLQIGGWQNNSEPESRLKIAWILGFWNNQSCYLNFMNQHHDAIIDSTHQNTTYENISVDCIVISDYALNNKSSIQQLATCREIILSGENRDRKFILSLNSQTQDLKLSLCSKNTIHYFDPKRRIIFNPENEWTVSKQDNQD